MATVDELTTALKKIDDNLKRIVGAASKHLNEVNYYFESLASLPKIISQEEAKQITSFAKILTDILKNAAAYTAVLKELCHEIGERGDVRALESISSALTHSLAHSHEITNIISDLERAIPTLADARNASALLGRSIYSLLKELQEIMNSILKEMRKTEEERKGGEEEEKAELIYEFDWYIFYDKGEKKRCEKKNTLPREITTAKERGRTITLKIPGGKARKGEKFISPRRDTAGVPYDYFNDAEFLGLAVKVLPSTGAEATIDYITKTSKRKWKWAFVEKERFPEEIKRALKGREAVSAAERKLVEFANKINGLKQDFVADFGIVEARTIAVFNNLLKGKLSEERLKQLKKEHDEMLAELERVPAAKERLRAIGYYTGDPFDAVYRELTALENIDELVMHFLKQRRAFLVDETSKEINNEAYYSLDERDKRVYVDEIKTRIINQLIKMINKCSITANVYKEVFVR